MSFNEFLMMLIVYGFCSRLELGLHRIIRAKANQIVVIRNNRNPRSQIDTRQASALSRVTSSPKKATTELSTLESY